MAQATIGSLNIVLGMDAGEFNKAVRDLNANIDKMAARFGIIGGIAAEAGRALVNSLGGALSAIGDRFRKALNEADAMDDLAQKVGLTSEALTRLSYAAEISGVPLDAFTVGLTRLSKALGEVAGGDEGSAAARTFAALGITVTTAGGQLRDTEQILGDLAAKFASFQDGAGKTALALNLFGKSGAQLIPFLNAGREGIAQLSAEADRLGITMSSRTTAAANLYGDTLNKLSRIVDAVFRQAVEKVLPYLQSAADWLLQNDRLAKTLGATLDGLTVVVRSLASVFIALYNTIANAVTAILGFNDAAAKAMTLDFSGASEAWRKMTDDISARSRASAAAIDELWGAMNRADAGQGSRAAADLQGFQPPVQKPDAPILRDPAEAKKAEAQAQALHNAELRKYLDMRKEENEILSTLDPAAAKFAETQDKLGRALQRGAIDAQTYGIAMSKASALAQSSYAGMASSIVGDLGKVFENNKAVAIAQALINTYQAVTNAWANVPYPLNIAAAAASLAAGLAQVANIKSTTKNSGGGGGGSSAASVNPQAAEAAPQQGIFISLAGNGRYTAEEVRGLISQINEAQADGTKITVYQ